MRAFLSYSVADRHFAGAVKQALENLGIECFLAHEDICVSEEWKQRILQELVRADLFIALLSANFQASLWCSQEVGFIVSRLGVLIVPLSLDQTNPYGFISHLQGQRVPDETVLPRILETLLWRERPHEMISIQIGRVRDARSFRGAEAAVKPLVECFNIFTDQEVADFASAAVSNYEVGMPGGVELIIFQSLWRLTAQEFQTR